MLRQDPAPATRGRRGLDGDARRRRGARARSRCPTSSGRDEAEAVAALSSAGLEVNVEERAVDTPSQDGVVLEQNAARRAQGRARARA